MGLVIHYCLTLRQLDWLDTCRAVALAHISAALPFAIWPMVSYFEEIPREIEEAALLNRAGPLRALLYVTLSQARGDIAVTVVFLFLNAWNEFRFAVVRRQRRAPGDRGDSYPKMTS